MENPKAKVATRPQDLLPGRELGRARFATCHLGGLSLCCEMRKPGFSRLAPFPALCGISYGERGKSDLIMTLEMPCPCRKITNCLCSCKIPANKG